MAMTHGSLSTDMFLFLHQCLCIYRSYISNQHKLLCSINDKDISVYEYDTYHIINYCVHHMLLTECSAMYTGEYICCIILAS